MSSSVINENLAGNNLVDSLIGMVRNKAADLSTATTASTSSSPWALLNTPFTFFFGFCLLLWAVRVVILKSLVALGRSKYAETLRITRKPVITDKQLEREAIWVYGYGYDTVAMVLIYYMGHLNHLSLASNLITSVCWMLFWHAVVVEPIYYAFHRLLHWQWFYKNFHQYHHKSINTEPTTGVSFEIYERVSYTILFAVSPLIVDQQGYSSYLSFALYYVWFDIMNEGGHINFEPLPNWWLNSPLKYVFYSPSFHSVHHTKFKKNYSLFMPYTDLLFGTAVYSESKDNAPLLPVKMPAVSKTGPQRDFVLLVHGANMESTLYSLYLHPKLAPLMKYTNLLEHKFSMYLFYPYLLVISFYLTFIARIGYHVEEDFTFMPQKPAIQSPVDEEMTHLLTGEQLTGSTWAIRNLGFQYVIPSFKKKIQQRIERAILDANDQNVKVVALGNFNKAEWMNHGGTDIVAKLGDRLTNTVMSHGDTLSAAVIYQYAMSLRQKGYWSRGVMVTGSTSKIGRALVLSLANQHVPVVMFTQVKARFDEIAAEAGSNASYLTFANDLSECKSCDLWLTGKMIPSGKELLDGIPHGATVVNFSVPDPLTNKLLRSRPDLLHLDTGLLAYNPKVMDPRFTWLLPSGLIYACLAGGIVHAALGIRAHEVGCVVVADMEKYWNAALAFGFSIPPPTSFYLPIVMPAPKKLSVTTV